MGYKGYYKVIVIHVDHFLSEITDERNVDSKEEAEKIKKMHMNPDEVCLMVHM